VLAGHVDGKPFRTETTLLPDTEIVQWPPGHPVEALLSQYVAYLDGRIEEVALDRYAQADDGSVWYLGEAVSDFKHGRVVVTEGTWLAGRDGPGAMIMPGHPKVGQVYRSENLPGVAFEEVTVKDVGRTVQGPHGPVHGAMIGSELHSDATREDKTFAPGYGEFFTGGGGDVEAMALAVPADELPGPVPAALQTLSRGGDDVFAQAGSPDWGTASATVRRMTAAWRTYQQGQVPPRLVPGLRRALDGLTRAVAARNSGTARHQAIAAGQAALDLQLRYRDPAEIDRGRAELWTRQVLVDAAARDTGSVTGDIATIKLIRNRFEHALDPLDRTRVDNHLLELETKLVDGDIRAVSAEAARLRNTLTHAQT
jgi:hypothetical protein